MGASRKCHPSIADVLVCPPSVADVLGRPRSAAFRAPPPVPSRMDNGLPPSGPCWMDKEAACDPPPGPCWMDKQAALSPPWWTRLLHHQFPLHFSLFASELLLILIFFSFSFKERKLAGSLAESARQWKYDVFLSFRGGDTRRSFVSHLYHELENSGEIRTFKDDEHLEIGEDISQSLLMAIEESRSAIIVLSKNYAFSAWCLDELTKICQCMKGKKRILPIFFYVDPSVVRYQKDTFGVALEKHARSGRYDIVKVNQWRADLTKVGSISGWHSNDYKTERDLIEDIQKYVLKTVRQGRF